MKTIRRLKLAINPPSDLGKQLIHNPKIRDEARYARHWELIDTTWFETHAGPNFSPEELADSRTGQIIADPEFLNMLRGLREVFCQPIVINSGFRMRETNAAVGGHERSAHLYGRAVDVRIPDAAYGADLLATALNIQGAIGIGINKPQGKTGFIHIDDMPRNGSKKPVIWTY